MSGLVTPEAVAVLLASIAPDPGKAKNCRTEGCWGKKGYYGVKINPDKSYTVLLCCGRVGQSDHERIMTALVGMRSELHSVHTVVRYLGTTNSLTRWWKRKRADRVSRTEKGRESGSSVQST